MNKKPNLLKAAALSITVLLISSFTFIEIINWKVQETYKVTFISKKINGTFKGLSAAILFDEADLSTSKIHASINATTFDSGNSLLNDHAKSETGLDTGKFPAIVFESSSIAKTKAGYEATGKLTMKGISKEIKIPFTFSDKIFTGKFIVIPADYNITRGGTPDQMEIDLVIPVTKN